MNMKLKTEISLIRSFNRFYTNILGLIDQHILKSEFSLSEVRVLHEIEKTETKIAQWQEHLKMLLVQKKQLEDTEILKSIRSMRLESRELLQVLEKLQKGEFQLTGNRYENPRKSDFSEKEETKEETNGEREI